MIKITPHLSIAESDIKIVYVCSPGPGGQNVNKLATAAQLRFNVRSSPSLPEDLRIRLLNLLGDKLTREGEIIIKASRHRTQERNRQDAMHRLIALLKDAVYVPKKRKKTRPTRASVERRINEKKLRGKTKSLRGGKGTLDT
jgi:ribosome-associated protein